MMKSLSKKFARIAVVAAAAASSVTGLAATAAPASATVSPTGFVSVQCDPNRGTIRQSVEFRRTANESIRFRGVLEQNGRFFYSPDRFENYAVNIDWTASRGEYRVWLQYGVWNTYTRSYAWYNYQLTGSQVQTFGRQDGYNYFNGISGRCVI